MRTTRHRTLMLEPQWHPIRWGKKNTDLLVVPAVLWNTAGALAVSLPNPKTVAIWPAWRWALFGLACVPALAVAFFLLAMIILLIGQSLRWCYRNPPFKLKTRWP